MSSIYSGTEVLRLQDPQTHKPPLSPARLSNALGKDRKNFAEQWGKERLTPAMRNAVEDAVPFIHEDTPLHSYGWRLIFALRPLRDAEDEARARLRAAAASRSAEKIVRAYEYGVRQVLALHVTTIEKAVSLIDKDDGDGILSDDNLTDVYLAAAVLHTAMIVWEDAADALTAFDDPTVLDFEFLGLKGFVSVVDVAETSHALYSAAECELRRISRKNRKLSESTLREAGQMAGGTTPDGMVVELRAKEANEARLAQQDAEIAAIQIMSIASHALDWLRALPAYRAAMGAPRGLMERLSQLASTAPTALRNGVALLARLPKNQLLARNIAYQAIQCADEQSIRRAAELISIQQNVEIDAVWRVSIMDRRPLCEEIHLVAMFEDGTPKLLNTLGAAK